MRDITNNTNNGNNGNNGNNNDRNLQKAKEEFDRVQRELLKQLREREALKDIERRLSIMMEDYKAGRIWPDNPSKWTLSSKTFLVHM